MVAVTLLPGLVLIGIYESLNIVMEEELLVIPIPPAITCFPSDPDILTSSHSLLWLLLLLVVVVGL